MKDLIIFGITPFSKLIEETIRHDQKRTVSAFCVNKAFLPEKRVIDKIPVVAFEKLNQLYDKNNFEILVTVGYKNMNENRRKMFALCDENGYSIASYIHSSVRCEHVKLGRGNIILQDCILHRNSEIGEGNIFVDNTTIGHETTVGNFNFFAGMATGGLVSIGNFCFLGMRSLICQECSVGDYTLLGAGTVLSKDSEPHTVVMPAANRTLKMNTNAMNALLI